MFGVIVLLFVYAKHDGEVLVLRGGGDDDLFHRAAQMLLRFVGVGELSSGLDDDLSSDGLPGQDGGIFFLENLNDFAVDGNAVRAGSDLVRQVPEDRVVLEQVSQRLGIGEIVDSDEIDVLVGERGAQNVAPDASKSINANFYGHGASKRNFSCLKKYARA